MTATDSFQRAGRAGGSGSDLLSRWLGHPVAYVLTAVILLALFVWPFIADPDRVAPTKDPAYYTWRTEALLTESPETVLGIEGPNRMFAAGYRVTAPVIGGLLRHVGDIHSLSMTIFLMVGLPVLISLLLAGFAHRYMPDPVIWHAIAFGSAGMLLTPPFVGYLDNVLCLFFLAASLYFLESTRESWPARLSFFLLLLLAGLTHPTTLVIFCGVLGLMAGARLVVTRFSLRDTWRADAWMLGVAFASVVATVGIWTVGIWGPSVSLTEAALPPPYGSSFFMERMLLWVDTMRPLLNGPLFVLGAASLLALGRAAWRDHFPRAVLLGLSPLVGLFGFLGGLTYPYYRFFNTTLSWVLLVGLGAGVAIRYFLLRTKNGGLQRIFVLGVLAVVFVLATNLSYGFQVSGWTKVKNQWLEPQARVDLDELRSVLSGQDRDRPVVFVVDDEPPEPFQIYGFTKLMGNTSRYGLPPGQIDRGYLYLGDLDNLLNGEPTKRGDETYDKLSVDFLADAQEGIERADKRPIYVVAEAFNPAGANEREASGEADFTTAVTARVGTPGSSGPDLWTLHDGQVQSWGPDGPVFIDAIDGRAVAPDIVPHWLRVLLGLLVLFAPGLVALRRIRPGASIAEALGLVPAIGISFAAVAGIAAVAFVREPFTESLAWVSAIAAVLAAVVLVAAGGTAGRPLSLLDRLPSARSTGVSRALWLTVIFAVAAGIAGWALGSLVWGIAALWAFCLAAAALALVLPLPLALVSPLFMGIAGWLVDMLPLVILVGWTVCVLRWAVGVLTARRWPRGGWFVWLAIGLVVWTGLGVLVITPLDFKHFLLLCGIQVIASGAILAVVDSVRSVEDRVRIVQGLMAFVILLSVGVFLQWIGLDIQALQNGEPRKRVEAAYGVDAFPNNIGMIKYARSINAGSLELRRELDALRAETPEMPAFDVFRPKFQAYENSLVVRFRGSARPVEEELSAAGVTLLFDNIGLHPANTVPRMRSFPRNALTFAGICAALFPFAFFLRWSENKRRRLFGAFGIVACLFGAAFSLARGAWVAILIGIVYLLLDTGFSRRHKRGVVVAYLIAALVLTGVFLIKYKVDPVTGRAGGGASVITRADLYQDTLGIFKGPPEYILLGYGTEKPRTESGTVKEGQRYVPRAGTHSTYLNYLFRTGVLGMLGIMVLYGLAFLHARTGGRKHEGREGGFSALAGVAVMIAAAHGVILSLYVEPIYTLTISLLIGVAAASVMSSEVKLRPPRMRLPNIRLPRLRLRRPPVADE